VPENADRPACEHRLPPKLGVYFLANDSILELAIAFLNSFRTHNPSIALCLIPFDDHIEQLAALHERYDFSIWRDEEALERCDALSLSFHDQALGHYRKLAAWGGDYSHFAYIDSDTVVLQNIDFVFDHLERFSFVTSHSHMPEIRKFVWKESIDAAGLLTSEQVAFAANTGFIASKRGCLDLGDVTARLPAALELVEHMELSCYEQPFLNFLMVTSGLEYTSLHAIAHASGSLSIPRERWGGDATGIVVRDGRVVSPESPPTLLVHWAGEWRTARDENRQIRLHQLWSFYRDLQHVDLRSHAPVAGDK